MNTKKIIEAIKATGADARETALSAGLYYDGTQHGELIPAIYVSVDKYTATGYNANAASIAMEARKAAGRFKGIAIKEIYHPSFYIYTIMATADAERAERLQNEAEIFLEAFHEERHRLLVSGEPDDAEKAIAAGHAALIAAGYEVKAA